MLDFFKKGDLASVIVPLNLSWKKITILKPNDFQGLFSLEKLSLQFNKLTEIGEYVFSPLGFSKKAHVFIRGNALTEKTRLLLMSQLADRLDMDDVQNLR